MFAYGCRRIQVSGLPRIFSQLLQKRQDKRGGKYNNHGKSRAMPLQETQPRGAAFNLTGYMI